MNIIAVGLSHKTAPVEIREKLSIPEEKIEQAIARLCSYPHIQEAAILSTCNRLEIYLAVLSAEQAILEVTHFLSEHSKLSTQELNAHLFTLLQQDAVMHLMQVASGLDSLVMGEGQILAQVKHAYKLGQQHNGIKQILNQLFKQSLTVAKKVRTETSIGIGAISISAAAVELAQVKMKDLSAYRVAIVGAGKMSRLLVQHLLSKGARRISIINRSIERAQELASQFSEAQLQCYLISNMMTVIAASDLVFTSTASTEPLLDRAKVEMILGPNQPLMLFDISVPRNVHADINELAHVQVFNVDDLKAVVMQNHESRRQAAMEAQKLIVKEVEAFRVWLRSLEAVSTISCLREKVESIREQELEKAMLRLGSEFGKKHQEVIEALTKGIVNKILHEPMVQLRTQKDLEAQRLAVCTLQMLFNLDTEFQNRSISKTTTIVTTTKTITTI
ncbi:glutamyl-tRNA reductase [Nostoc commune]|uniref:glutamyl-tRNA reductase n=1 Tax=Nostoc commune TaxID=1178 RepID=UPI0018C603AB|nr:glutamyl-tRNA reductase [Nostoc commune]MBG1259716.1 glutamyl-tRNA reductase [Nostoc commune BAE]